MITRIEDGLPASKANYKTYSKYESATVPIFSFENTLVTPPAGKLWKILNMMLFVEALPLAASAGEHSFTLFSKDIPILYGASVYDSDLVWRYSMWEIAGFSQKPASNEAALIALDSIHLTTTNYLTVKYINNTNEPQVYQRIIRLSVIETPLI